VSKNSVLCRLTGAYSDYSCPAEEQCLCDVFSLGECSATDGGR
jgi:hypothetical protein